ncbi:MAG: hypothetical protein GXY14_00845 [Spirochaetes bacterium]|nr:hypothetical protein [Spirochaetota bacterium]
MNNMEKKLEKEIIRVAKKPGKCPVCGSVRIANYIYGIPEFTTELDRHVDDGRFILGGCCITDDDPLYRCTGCKTDFYRVKP